MSNDELENYNFKTKMVKPFGLVTKSIHFLAEFIHAISIEASLVGVLFIRNIAIPKEGSTLGLTRPDPPTL